MIEKYKIGTVGIYCIRNLTTSKMYVGSSCNIKYRWTNHKRNLNRGTHDNQHLQRAWNKYGDSDFIFAILETTDVDSLLKLEDEYLMVAELYPYKYYNMNYKSTKPPVWIGKDNYMFGRNGVLHPKYGTHHSEYTRKLISENQKGILANNYDYTIYKFKNRITNEIFEGTQYDFRIKYDLNKGNLGKVLSGKKPSIKNWICLKN